MSKLCGQANLCKKKCSIKIPVAVLTILTIKTEGKKL